MSVGSNALQGALKGAFPNTQHEDEFELLRKEADNSGNAYRQAEDAYKQAAARAQELEINLRDRRRAVFRAQAAARKSSDPRARTFADTLLHNYQKMAQDGYASARREYTAAYDAMNAAAGQYRAAVEKYNAAAQSRNSQMNQQQIPAPEQPGYASWPQEDQNLLREYIDNRIHHDENMAQRYMAAEAQLYEKYGKETVQQMAQLYSRDRRMEQEAADAAVMEGDQKELESWTPEDRKLLADYVNNRFYNTAEGAESYEQARVTLWGKYGKERVEELAETYRRQQNAVNAQQVKADADALTETTGGKILGSVAAVGGNILGGITGTFGYLDNLLTGTGRYSTLDPNAMGTEMSGFGRQVTRNVAESIRGEKEEGEGITWGDVGATVYQAGMSALENITRLVLTGGTGSLALAATGSFTNTVQEASRQGATPVEATALGIVTGGLEVLTEKISLDNLLKQASGNYGSLVQAVKAAFRAGVVEVSEEELNFLCSAIAEAAILREKSSYAQQIQELVANGMDYEAAKEQADRAHVMEAAQTAVQSFLSGGMMSGATSVYTNVMNRMQPGRNGGTEAVQEAAQAPQTEETAGEETAPEPVEAVQEEESVDPMDDLADRMEPVRAALTAYRGSGTVSNRLAEIILGQSRAVQELTEKTGIAMEGTKSQRRQAVKEAVAALAAQEDAAKAQAENTPEAIRQRQFAEASREVMGMTEENGEAETNAVGKPLDSYPAEKQNMIRSYIQAVDGKIKNFVQRVKSGDLTFKRQKISDVSARAAADIGRILGINVSGYTHNINTNGIRHIINRHGENGKADHTMALDDDIARIGWVLENYDSVEPVTENGEQIYSGEFLDKNHNPAPQIKFVKKIDGSYYVVEAAFENDYKKLWVQSAYLQKNGDVTQAPAEGPPANHETNAQSALASPSPGNSITEKGGEVNGENRGAPEGFEAMGAASANFSGKQAFNELLSDENAQPDRPGDIRPMEIPKTDGYGRRVSEFAANAYGAEVTPDSMADRIQELIGDGALGFDTRTNEESLRNAAGAIQEKGMASTRNQITRSVADGKIKDGDIEKALLLYTAYANKKGQAAQDNAAELMVDLAAMANITGRNLQMFKLLRRMTPEGQLMTVQKTVQRNVDKLNGRRGKKDQIQVEIPQELQDDYLDAAKKDAEEGTKETAKKKEEIENAIYLAAASQIKGTWAEKWNTWRYMAMLGNVKTQVRNIVGNVAYIPYTEAKRALGAAMERLIPKEKRTKAIVGLSESDRALRDWAKADSKTDAVRDALKYSAKLGDDVAASKMEEGRRIFDTEILEQARKIVEKVPAAGDMLFKNREYSEALAGFLKARGYTAADIQSGKVSEAVLNEGRTYAISEAMKATFNDCNLFSDFVSNFRYKGSNPIGKAVNLLGEGILPFRRTPANIVVRMVENSPVNMARSLWNMATKVRTGEMSAATAIDQMAAGLTGTGAMALGFLLAKGLFGIKLRGSDVDEDEKRQGHQAYAIEFSLNGKEYSYKIDWAAPANLPLFVGANLYDLWENRGEDTGLSAFTSFMYAMGNMFEPMLSLSCMSSLNDAIESAKYAEDGTALYAFFANAVTNYFTQGIPALARQAYQATQETKQQTFANSEDPLLRDIQRTAANLPFAGAAFQTDTIDQWGKKESRGNLVRRLFDAFFNPGTLKEIDNSALEQEITRLNESQEESVAPPDTPKTISFTDKDGNRHQNRRLTEEEWNTLRTVQGQTAADILNTMIASADYAALTDQQKSAAFGYVYDYAREMGRTEAIEGYDGMDGWMEGIEGEEAGVIIGKVVTGHFSDGFDSLTAGNADRAVKTLEGAYRVYEALSAEQRKTVAEGTSGRVADCIAAMNAGVDAATFAGLYQTYYDIGKTDKSAAEQANDWSYTLQRAVETGTITAKQRDVLKENMTISSGFTVETEKFDSMVESGLTADRAEYIDDLLRGIEPQKGYTTVRPVQQAEAIAGAKLTESEKIAVMKLYMNDAQDENLDAMLEMGFDAADYAKAYRIYSDEDGKGGRGTKARTIAEFQKLFGVDYDTAKAIYEIYG